MDLSFRIREMESFYLFCVTVNMTVVCFSAISYEVSKQELVHKTHTTVTKYSEKTQTQQNLQNNPHKTPTLAPI